MFVVTQIASKTVCRETIIRADEETKDIAIIRVLATGRKAQDLREVQVDLILHYDQETRFTAMEQATGWHAVILPSNRDGSRRNWGDHCGGCNVRRGVRC